MNNTIGGVSPLKAREPRQSSRGGEYAGTATRTVRRRGGFAESRGERGAGGRNVGGYNVQTSFNPDAVWQKPPSGGTTIIPQKPYTINKEGEVEMNIGYEHREDPAVVTKSNERKSGGSYPKMWKANKDNFQDKWKDKDKDGDGGYEAWKNAAIAWNKKQKPQKKTVAGQKYERKYSQKGDEDKVYDINENTDSEGWYKVIDATKE